MYSFSRFVLVTGLWAILSMDTATFAQTTDSIDVFPLAPGLTYTYLYHYQARSHDLFGFEDRYADSGLVVYTVKDSARLADTAISWSVNERSTLGHQRFSTGDTATTYWTTSTDTTKDLIETLAGRHSLRSSFLVWSFPMGNAQLEAVRYADSVGFLLAGPYLGPLTPPSYANYDSLWFSSARGFYRQSGHAALPGVTSVVLTLEVELLEGPTGAKPAGSSSPTKFALLQNYPNPFNPSTVIGYVLPRRSHATLDVFNSLGQQVATLVHGNIEPGYHEVNFDASSLSSGVYFYRFSAGDFVQTKKMILIH